MNYLNDNIIQNENLFWRKDKMATVRSGNYKLIRLNDTSTVLYNIENNYFEDLKLKEPFMIHYSSYYQLGKIG